MNGEGVASAALTVVNALPTGIGCAIGIRRYARASARIDPRGPPGIAIVPDSAGSRLTRAAADAAVRRFGNPESAVRLELESAVPIGKGLKSSSAVASAIIRATARALGSDPDPIDVARLSAEVGRASGVSATGAFDDALAGLRSGVVLTDNGRDAPLSIRSLDPAWVAVVGVPAGTHPTAPSLLETFRREASSANPAVSAARQGHWAEAMTENSRLVERVLGYEYDALRERLTGAGALAVGVSGLGPAFAALAIRTDAAAVLRSLPADLEERFVVDFTSEAEGAL